MSFTLWRGVVGMVRPTRRPGTLEELIRILPEGIGIVPLMLNFRAGSAEEFLKSIPQYEQYTAELAEQGVDLIVLTGAPPFMLLGPKDEAALIRKWEKKYKVPIVTDPQMHVAGMKAMKIKKFIGASYSALQNEIVLKYMNASGLKAVSMEPIDVPFDQVAQISSERLYQHVKMLWRKNPGRRRHLHPGRRLADRARGRDAGEGLAGAGGARLALRGVADPQAPDGARDRAGLRAAAGRVAVGIADGAPHPRRLSGAGSDAELLARRAASPFDAIGVQPPHPGAGNLARRQPGRSRHRAADGDARRRDVRGRRRGRAAR